MTRLVHLTDLHFGRERPELVAPLADALRAAAPALVVVTGDLSHRARAGQFRRAMAFLTGLGLPLLLMPGNHDVPLINLPLRFLAPFHGWRRSVGPAVPPVARAGAFRVLAANTADPFRWRRGLLRRGDLRAISAALAQDAGGAVNVLACHHPLVEPPGFQRGETRGARVALPGLARQGLHIVLSGHLHHWSIGLGIAEGGAQPLLMVQTGTALCGRAGEADHGFSVLDLDGADLTVTPWIVEEARRTFVPRGPLRFRRAAEGWIALSAPPPSPASTATADSGW